MGSSWPRRKKAESRFLYPDPRKEIGNQKVPVPVTVTVPYPVQLPHFKLLGFFSVLMYAYCTKINRKLVYLEKIHK
jgi:hypothetical protein